jgi:hypothetical protein
MAMADLFCVYCGHSLRSGIEGQLLEVCPSCSNVAVSSEELISGKKPAPRVRELPEVRDLPEVMALPEVLGLPEVEIPSLMPQSIFPPPLMEPLAGLEPSAGLEPVASSAPTEVVKPLERKQDLPQRPQPVKQAGPVRKSEPVRQPQPVKQPEPVRKPEPAMRAQPVGTEDPWREVPGTMTFELPPGRQVELPPPSLPPQPTNLPPQLPPRREEGDFPRRVEPRGGRPFPRGNPKAGPWPRRPGEAGQPATGAKRWVPYAAILAFILSFGGPGSPLGRLFGAAFLAAVLGAGYAAYASTKGKDMGESFYRTFAIAIVVIAFLMRN